MKIQKSIHTATRYPLRLILKVAELSSGAWYDNRLRIKPENRCKRGPHTLLSDDTVLEEIKALLKEPQFIGEGYIKIHNRLKRKNINLGKNRVFRIMKGAKLLNQKTGNSGSGRAHDGTIITDKPNKMWATDGKQFYTAKEGKCWFIGVIDHFNDEIKSFHVCTVFDRFAAMESLRTAVRKEFGNIERGVCADINLALRADHGSQFDSSDFRKEIKFLGLNYSPAFVRSPECNGIIERFHRTLNEQIFKIDKFDSLEEAHEKLTKFVDNYNENWMLHRLKLKTPIEFRREYDTVNLK